MNAYLQLCRLHRPAGIFLVMLPCWWGVSVAGGHIHSPHTLWLLLLFTIGATLMRGAGCTLNDMVDRNIDRHVARTQTRPLVTGEISLRRAGIFLGIQCLAGLGVLLALPARCWILAPVALCLLGIYPFMKRVTYWPQLVLGLAFNLGIFFGSASIMPFEQFNWPAVLALYGAGIFWTVGYDTIYALQDRKDDLKIGVKSTAIRFGQHVRIALYITYGIMFILLTGVGYSKNASWLYYMMVGKDALLTGIALWFVRPDNTQNCLKAFNANTLLGFIIWTALIFLH